MAIDLKYDHLFQFPDPPRPKKKESPPPPGLYITEKPEEADYKACAVEAPERVKNVDLIEGHDLVKWKHDADTIIVFTYD